MTTPTHADRVVASLAGQLADQAVRIAVLEAELADARAHLEHHHDHENTNQPDAPTDG